MKRFDEFAFEDTTKRYDIQTLINSDRRLRVFFTKGHKCVKCGLTGSLFALEKSGNRPLHLNLYAETKMGEIMMTIDHIIPLSKGGMNIFNNLQPMCAPCNFRKGNKL